jgi:Flp pilus assembly protein TadG
VAIHEWVALARTGTRGLFFALVMPLLFVICVFAIALSRIARRAYRNKIADL